MSVVDSILNFWSRIGSLFTSLINSINSIWTSIIQVLSYIWSILKALWLWLTSLLSPLWELIWQVLWNGAVSSLLQAIDRISSYIWWPATVFIMTLFVIILTRIVIWFVFKIMRLNIDYHVLQNRTEKWNRRDIAQHKN